MDIDTGDHPPMAQKEYTLPLKHSKWGCEEWDMLEKAGIILRSVSLGLVLLLLSTESSTR